jgi:hydroxyacylglutathione hydrolase
MHIKTFIFNPLRVNTYLIYDDNKNGIVIDPGMMSFEEQKEFKQHIDAHKIKLTKVLFTHGHFDHIAGSAWIKQISALSPTGHAADNFLIDAAGTHAAVFGLNIVPPAPLGKEIEHNDTLFSGDITLHCRLVPGHSPGSIAFVDHASKSIFSGDTLFLESIGRTDLPGGDYDVLIQSIQEQLISLPPDYTLYPGHGPASSVGNEMAHNPFLNG